MTELADNKILRVKDNRNISFLIVGLCILPLVFMLFSSILLDNYLSAFIGTIFLYFLFFVWFMKDLKKRENEFAIIADRKEVTFKNRGTFQWNEIASIDTLTKIDWVLDILMNKSI